MSDEFEEVVEAELWFPPLPLARPAAADRDGAVEQKEDEDPTSV
jgi:hypothetical protein